MDSVPHTRCQNEGALEADCGLFPSITRRPSYRVLARRGSGTRTPHPSREVSSGGVDPTSLKLVLILIVVLAVVLVVVVVIVVVVVVVVIAIVVVVVVTN